MQMKTQERAIFPAFCVKEILNRLKGFLIGLFSGYSLQYWQIHRKGVYCHDGIYHTESAESDTGGGYLCLLPVSDPIPLYPQAEKAARSQAGKAQPLRHSHCRQKRGGGFFLICWKASGRRIIPAICWRSMSLPTTAPTALRSLLLPRVPTSFPASTPGR